MEHRENYPFQEEETFDFRKYLFMFLRNWYWFVISLLLAYSIAYYINRFSENVYNVGGARVIVRHERMRSQGMERFIEGVELLSSQTTVQNQMEVLKSFELNKRVIDQLDFDITYVAIGRFKNAELYHRDADIRVRIDESESNRKNYPINLTILSETEYRLEINEDSKISNVLKFGESFSNQNFNFTVDLVNKNYRHNQYYFIINDPNTLINRYRGKLRIGQNDPATGSVLSLSTTGKVPQQEADYLNKLMEVFVIANLEEKNETAVNTIEFIDVQLMEISDSLQQIESALTTFQHEYDILNISREGENLFSRAENYQSQKLELLMKQKYFDYLQDYLSGKSHHKDIIAPSIVGISDPLLGSLVAQLNTLYSDRRILQYDVRENNPRLIQIDEIIKEVTATVLENLNSLQETHRIVMDDLESRMEVVREGISRLPLAERRMLTIDRRFSLNNNLYNYLMQKRSEASLAQAANISDNRILDYARPANATVISPNRSRNVSKSVIIGLGLPFIIILLLDFLNTRINDKNDIVKKTRVPILGNVGHNNLKSEFPIEENPKSAIAESFRSVRTNLHYVLRKEGSKVISITSTVSGEGKTFCAVNLAGIIAMSGKKTLLVGLDLRKPKINRLFGFDKEVGLSTYLIGKYTEADIIEKTDIDNLDIITSGPIPPNPAELLQSEQMDRFMESVKKRYDYIVFDTPPVAIVSDALIVNRFADITVFVVRQNYSSKHVLDFINDHADKEDYNINILINDVKAQGYNGYGYGYGYGYGSHGYYGEEENRSYISRLKQLLRS